MPVPTNYVARLERVASLACKLLGECGPPEFGETDTYSRICDELDEAITLLEEPGTLYQSDVPEEGPEGLV